MITSAVEAGTANRPPRQRGMPKFLLTVAYSRSFAQVGAPPMAGSYINCQYVRLKCVRLRYAPHQLVLALIAQCSISISMAIFFVFVCASSPTLLPLSNP